MKPVVFLAILLIVPSVLTDRRYKNRKPAEKAPETEGSLIDDKWQADFANRANVILQVLKNFEKKLEWFRKTDKIQMTKESVKNAAKQSLQSVLEGKDKLEFNTDMMKVRSALKFDDPNYSLELREKALMSLCQKWSARRLVIAQYKWMTGWDYDGTMKNMQWCYPAIAGQQKAAEPNNEEEEVAIEAVKTTPPEPVVEMPSLPEIQVSPVEQAASSPDANSEAVSIPSQMFSSDLFNELMGKLSNPVPGDDSPIDMSDVPKIAPLDLTDDFWKNS